MIDILLAFGCSNTYGSEAIIDFDKGLTDESINNQYAYPKYLADRIGCKYKNYAIPGTSNTEIASKVLEVVMSPEFEEYSNPFIIIGWTEDERMPIMNNKNKQHTFTMAEAIEAINNKREWGFAGEVDGRVFAHNAICNIFSSPFYNKTHFFIKYATTSLLLTKNIKHLTLPTLPYLHDTIYNLFLDNKNNIIMHNTKGKIVFEIFKQYKCYGVSSGSCHLRAAAHQVLAEHLFFECIKRQIIKADDVTSACP